MQSKLKPGLNICGNQAILKIYSSFVTFWQIKFSIEANELELPFLFDAVSFNRSLDSLNWVMKLYQVKLQILMKYIICLQDDPKEYYFSFCLTFASPTYLISCFSRIIILSIECKTIILMKNIIQTPTHFIGRLMLS